MTEGLKFDADKLRWSLLPDGVIEEVIKVLEYGARKYSEENWKLVEHAYTRYYDAAMRHISAWKQGETVDSESKQYHLAHAICCLMFLVWMDENGFKHLQNQANKELL